MSPLSPQQPGTPKMCEKGMLSSGIIYYLYSHCGHLHPDVCVWEKSNDTVDGKNRAPLVMPETVLLV